MFFSFLNSSASFLACLNCTSKSYTSSTIGNFSSLNFFLIFSLTNSCINKDFFEFLAAFQEKDYSKEYRTYREIDNFAENYLTVKIDSDKKKGTNNFGVCGMCYGGLELPIIYKVINNCITDILLFNFGKNISGYRNKQLVDLRRFNINNFGGITKVGNIQNDNIILLDDNVLTGKNNAVSY